MLTRKLRTAQHRSVFNVWRFAFSIPNWNGVSDRFISKTDKQTHKRAHKTPPLQDKTQTQQVNMTKATIDKQTKKVLLPDPI